MFYGPRNLDGSDSERTNSNHDEQWRFVRGSWVEFAIIDETAAYVLRRAWDGKLRAAILPLVTVSVVEPITDAA